MELALHNRLDDIARQRIAMGAGRRRRRGGVHAGVLVDDINMMPMMGRGYYGGCPPDYGYGEGYYGGVRKGEHPSGKVLDWINRVKAYQAQHGVSYKEALMALSTGKTAKKRGPNTRKGCLRPAYWRCAHWDHGGKGKVCLQPACYYQGVDVGAPFGRMVVRQPVRQPVSYIEEYGAPSTSLSSSYTEPSMSSSVGFNPSSQSVYASPFTIRNPLFKQR